MPLSNLKTRYSPPRATRSSRSSRDLVPGQVSYLLYLSFNIEGVELGAFQGTTEIYNSRTMLGNADLGYEAGAEHNEYGINLFTDDPMWGTLVLDADNWHMASINNQATGRSWGDFQNLCVQNPQAKLQILFQVWTGTIWTSSPPQMANYGMGWVFENFGTVSIALPHVANTTPWDLYNAQTFTLDGDVYTPPDDDDDDVIDETDEEPSVTDLVYGCMDGDGSNNPYEPGVPANNYDESATNDDGYCTYTPLPDATDSFRVELWDASTQTWLMNIASNVLMPDGGNFITYQWQIPEDIYNLINLPALLHIKIVYELNEQITQYSYSFTVQDPSSEEVSIIKLELLTSTGISMNIIIEDSAANDGSYDWYIPSGITTGLYKIRGTIQTPPFVYGDSAIFSIENSSTELHSNIVGALSTVTDNVHINNISDRLRIASGIENRPLIYQYIDRQFFGTTTDVFLHDYKGFFVDNITPEIQSFTPTTLATGQMFASGGGNGTFMNGKFVFYKFVAVYDGNQEALLPTSFISQSNAVADDGTTNVARAELKLTFNKTDWNPRVTHINVYRAIQDNNYAENSLYYKVDSIDTRASFGLAAQTWESATGYYFSDGTASYTDDGFNEDSAGYILVLLKGLNTFTYTEDSGATNTINEDQHNTYRADHDECIYGELDRDGAGGGDYLEVWPSDDISVSSGTINPTEENHVILSTAPTWDDWNKDRSSYFISPDAFGFEIFRDDSDLEKSGQITSDNWEGEYVTYLSTDIDAATFNDGGVRQIYEITSSGESFTKGGNGLRFDRNLEDDTTYLLSFRLRLEVYPGDISQNATDALCSEFDMSFNIYESLHNADLTDVEMWKHVLKVPNVPSSHLDFANANETNDRELQFTVEYTTTEAGNRQFWVGFIGASTAIPHIYQPFDLSVIWKKIIFARVSKGGTKSFIGSRVTSIPNVTFPLSAFAQSNIKMTQTTTGPVETVTYAKIDDSYDNLLKLPSGLPQWTGALGTNVGGSLEMLIEHKGWTVDGNVVSLTYTDWGLPNRSIHPYESASSIQVNYTYSKYMAGRLFVAGVRLGPDLQRSEDHKDWVMFSELGKPDVLPISNYISIEDVQGGEIVGLEEIVGDMIIFMTNGIFRLDVPKANPSSWSLIESEKNIGCNAPKSIVSFEGGVFFAGKDNFYLLNSNFSAVPLTYNIKDIYQKYNNSDTQAIFSPTKKELYLKLGGKSDALYKLSLSRYPDNFTWSKVSLGVITLYNNNGTPVGAHTLQSDRVSIDENNNLQMVSTAYDTVADTWDSKLLELDPSDPETTDIIYGTSPQTSINLIDKTRESVGFVRKTGWIQLGSLEESSVLRRVAIVHTSVDLLRMKIYVDGGSSPRFTYYFDANRAEMQWSDYYSIIGNAEPKADYVGVGLRAKFVQLKFYTDASHFPFELLNIRMEVD